MSKYLGKIDLVAQENGVISTFVCKERQASIPLLDEFGTAWLFPESLGRSMVMDWLRLFLFRNRNKTGWNPEKTTIIMRAAVCLLNAGNEVERPDRDGHRRSLRQHAFAVQHASSPLKHGCSLRYLKDRDTGICKPCFLSQRTVLRIRDCQMNSKLGAHCHPATAKRFSRSSCLFAADKNTSVSKSPGSSVFG